jgi:AbrB family looped-hinge helix DNA binding protein
MGDIFEGKVYGSVIVDDKGQITVPSELRKALNIKTGDQLIIFAELEMNSICLIPCSELKKFLKCASKLTSKLKNKVSD